MIDSRLDNFASRFHFANSLNKSAKFPKPHSNFQISEFWLIIANHTSTGEVSRLAILTTGVLIVVEVPSEEQAVEESKICDSKSENKPLRIAYSIKLPNMSIQDFDIDRNNNFVSLLTSEGNVWIYDLQRVESSEENVMNQKIKKCSRDTVSYHQELKYVWLDDYEWDKKQATVSGNDCALSNLLKAKNIAFDIGSGNFSAYIPEEGMTSRDSIKMKDIMSREFNTSKKYSKAELSKFSSPDQVQYGLTSNKKPLTQISSSRENYGDVEESKVHDARIINNLDESGITQMDDYLKMKPHEVAANLLSAGLSTKGLNKDMSQNIMIYKEGISSENEYIPRSK